ncbi:MliC family protein [Shimia sp.]|uniref:MliC family protein n=1 Tax=Shimia sp. TaxID=1954381 RepID=UPI0032979AC8
MKYVLFWLAGLAMTGPALAGDPSFDCTKAASSAEEAICASDDLAALDQELTRIYRLAVRDETLSTERVAELKTTQRGWIKGRDECWKSDLGVETCVAVEYGYRIAEIRTGYAAARDGDNTSIGPFAYVCEGMDVPLSVVFVNAGTARAVITWRDGAQVLTAGPTGSGVRYEASDMVFHTKGDAGMLTLNGQTMDCRQDDIG